MKRCAFILVVMCGTASTGGAQDFDREGFIEELNSALAGTGVTVESYNDDVLFWGLTDSVSDKETGFTVDLPEYGIGAFDDSGNLVQIFGPSVPKETNSEGEVIAIAGYSAPLGTKFQTIGADAYKEAIEEATYEVALDGGVKRAVAAMQQATAYIGSELCSSPARPSEITLSLNADFKLVFGASTGTTAKWILSETCTTN